MILGIKYQNIYPVPVHTFPNGLTIFKSKLKPTSPGVLACIGGPVEALENICGIVGAKPALGYMCNLIQNIKAPAPRINLNPLTKKKHFVDFNIPEVAQLLELEENDEEFDDPDDNDDSQENETFDKNPPENEETESLEPAAFDKNHPENKEKESIETAAFDKDPPEDGEKVNSKENNDQTVFTCQACKCEHKAHQPPKPQTLHWSPHWEEGAAPRLISQACWELFSHITILLTATTPVSSFMS